ncbi:MAG: glycosyltransferase, partial [Verrucomicrobiae bacterium]|nr:glycosyltransferase [Verrucomicrobiae bacterium]
MRIICLIDSLGPGGAQRQMAYLAVLLKEAGHDVRILKYHQLDFFEPYVVSRGVKVDVLAGLSPVKRILAVRSHIRRARPDAVIAFLPTPSLLAELSGLPQRRFRIIVSERGFDKSGPTFSVYRRLLFHTLADLVVTNSYSQADFIRRSAPWLSRKTTTILNCVDLEEFSPGQISANSSTKTRFLVLASLSRWKNPTGLARAMAILQRKRPDLNWSVDWYGNKLLHNGVPVYYSAYRETLEVIETAGLQSSFHLHDPHPKPAELYRRADAVILPSLHEGCPNVLCGAFACGLPVLASRVGEIPAMLED